jgi:hypothetical protein
MREEQREGGESRHPAHTKLGVGPKSEQLAKRLVCDFGLYEKTVGRPKASHTNPGMCYCPSVAFHTP